LHIFKIYHPHKNNVGKPGASVIPSIPSYEKPQPTYQKPNAGYPGSPGKLIFLLILCYIKTMVLLFTQTSEYCI